MRSGEYPDDFEDRRKKVLRRDDYLCQECGESEGVLQVHHITPISEGGSHKLENLETVCRSCHAKEHPEKITLNSAIGENRRIRMKYSSSSGNRVREVNPYALQMHEGIEYLVGYDHYRNEVRHFRPTRMKWVEETDKLFEAPSDFDASAYLSEQLQARRSCRGSSRQSSSGCFIATAAYGTPQAKEIDQLRDFRDTVLLQSTVGTLFVKLYYRLSPPVADWISRKHWRMIMVRKTIIMPALWLTNRWKCG